MQRGHRSLERRRAWGRNRRSHAERRLGDRVRLSEVEYLDSAGLRLIQRLREDLHVRGQKLQLVIPDGSVILDVLRLAGLDWSEEIVQSVQAGRRA